MLDLNDPLIVAIEATHQDHFNKSSTLYYSDVGRPAKPIRLMVGSCYLKNERIWVLM